MLETRVRATTIPTGLTLGTGATSITGGTVGSVLFVGAGPVVAQNNAQFFWDNTNNRLGIGTASPGTSLDVRGNITLLAGSDVRPTANSTTAINISNAAGTRFVTFDSTNSFVGIGTASPVYYLDILGASNQSLLLRVKAQGLSDATIRIDNSSAGSNLVFARGGVDLFNIYQTSGSSDLRFYSYNAARDIMRITSTVFILDATGTSIVDFDTTNSRFGLGTGGTPGYQFHQKSTTQTRHALEVGTAAASYDQLFGMEGTSPVAGSYFDIIRYTNATINQGFFNGGACVLHNSLKPIAVVTNDGSTTPDLYVNTAGLIAVSGTSPTAYLDLVASTTAAASLRIRAGSAPTTLSEGEIWNDATQKSLIGYIDAIQQRVPGVLYVSTANSVASNTTGEITLVSVGSIGTVNLPANFFTRGKSIRISARGFYTTQIVPVGVRVRAYLGGSGGTLIGDTGTNTPPGNASNLGHEIHLITTCRTTGASGTFFSQGGWPHHTSATDWVSWQMANTATQTVDTTVAQAIELTATWAAGVAAADSFAVTNLLVEALN